MQRAARGLSVCCLGVGSTAGCIPPEGNASLPPACCSGAKRRDSKMSLFWEKGRQRQVRGKEGPQARGGGPRPGSPSSSSRLGRRFLLVLWGRGCLPRPLIGSGAGNLGVEWCWLSLGTREGLSPPACPKLPPEHHPVPREPHAPPFWVMYRTQGRAW